MAVPDSLLGKRLLSLGIAKPLAPGCEAVNADLHDKTRFLDVKDACTTLASQALLFDQGVQFFGEARSLWIEKLGEAVGLMNSAFEKGALTSFWDNAASAADAGMWISKMDAHLRAIGDIWLATLPDAAWPPQKDLDRMQVTLTALWQSLVRHRGYTGKVNNYTISADDYLNIPAIHKESDSDDFRPSLLYGRMFLANEVIKNVRRYRPLVNTGRRIVETPLQSSIDVAIAERVASYHASYVDLLAKADTNYEFAMIGQQYRTRAVLVDGFARLEQQMHAFGVSIAGAIRAQSDLIERCSRAQCSAIAQASSTNQAQMTSLIASANRISDGVEAANRRLPSAWCQ